jgi:hypothetical protein
MDRPAFIIAARFRQSHQSTAQRKLGLLPALLRSAGGLAGEGSLRLAMVLNEAFAEK